MKSTRICPVCGSTRGSSPKHSEGNNRNQEMNIMQNVLDTLDPPFLTLNYTIKVCVFSGYGENKEGDASEDASPEKI